MDTIKLPLNPNNITRNITALTALFCNLINRTIFEDSPYPHTEGQHEIR